jgi:hypothetical protein
MSVRKNKLFLKNTPNKNKFIFFYFGSNATYLLRLCGIKISKPHDRRVSEAQILIPCYFLLASKLPGYVIRIPPFLYAGI